MHLVAIIVNYQAPELVLDCLSSLREELRNATGFHAVIVDNASVDGSFERLCSQATAYGWADWIRLIQCDKNDGFSAGNNTGIRSIEADAYLLLNSDTLVRPGLIAELRRAMEVHPEAGIIAPRLEWPDGAPQTNCFRWPRPRTELIRSASTGPITRLLGSADMPLPIRNQSTTEPEWVSFAAVLIRREVIEQIGLLDAGYFMYFEDVDYCRRAREAGWQILYWPSARVVHLRGGTSPVKSLTQQRKRLPAYYYESRARYYKKFFGRWGLWRANLCWMVGRGVSVCRERLQNRPRAVCECEWKDNWLSALKPVETRDETKKHP